MNDRPYEVSRGKVAEFARALGDANPVYRDSEAARQYGYRDVIAPPTFPIVVSLAALEDFLATEQVPLSRVVHATQAFELHRPAIVGDALVGNLSVTSRRAFGGNEMVVTTTIITTVVGELIAKAEATVLVTAENAKAPPVPTVLPPTDVRQGANLVHAMPHAPVEFTDGMRLSSVLAIGREDLVRYAGASGDFNPIHFSSHAAGKLGLPDVIAHGMLTMGLAARLLTAAVGDPGRLRKISTKFSNPVVVPDDSVGAVIEFDGVVTATDSDFSVALGARCGEQKVLNQAKALVRA